MDFFKKIRGYISTKWYIFRAFLYYTFPLGRKAYVIGTPEYENLGDSAITIAEILFIEKCGYGRRRIKELTKSDFDSYIMRYGLSISSDSLICGVGGGNMGNQWIGEEAFRRSLIDRFSENKIVIFPQTLFFSDDEDGKNEKAKTIACYSGHHHLFLAARELTSYKIMKDLFRNNNVLLAPDIVLSTTAEDYGVISGNREGALLVFRSDSERVLSADEREIIIDYLDGNHIDYRFTDMNSDVKVNKFNRFDLVKSKMQEFAASELVITDRLHGMVFAALSGTPCIALSNCNHKIKGTFEWLKDLGYIRYARSAEEAVAFIPEMLKLGECSYDVDLIRSFFKPLEDELSAN